MGRNRKNGLDYFPFDIDTFQDIKIRKLIKYQSGKAVTVYALLLCLIYKSGYYMRWDEELPFIISEQTGFEEAYIQEVIKSCMVLGLFSKELFDKEQVLTSRGIQERYREICKQIKRKCDFSEYPLISSEKNGISSEKMGISSEEIGISSEEKPINSEKIPQNKKKEKEIIDSSIPPTPPKGVVSPPKPRKERAKKAEPTLNAKARQVFEAHYKATFDQDYYWSAKDAGNMSKLLDKLKYQRSQKGLTNEDAEVLDALSAFLNTIHDGWIFDNFSVANINSKFNELRAQAINKQHGNSSKNSRTNPATDDDDAELMRHVAAGIARGYYERQQRRDGGEPLPGQ